MHILIKFTNIFWLYLKKYWYVYYFTFYLVKSFILIQSILFRNTKINELYNIFE